MSQTLGIQYKICTFVYKYNQNRITQYVMMCKSIPASEGKSRASKCLMTLWENLHKLYGGNFPALSGNRQFAEINYKSNGF
jgi:hypothetical protein